MKVVHISTYDTGGAGIAAMRLHRQLNKIGVESRFLCLHQSISSSDTIKYESNEGILSKIYNNLLRKDADRALKSRFPGCGTLSVPFSHYDVSNHPALHNADVIHLHWVARFIDYPSFFRKLKMPIVWTLHDMNPFMGVVHYGKDLERGYEELDTYENRMKRIKKRAFQEHGNIHIVSPSKWLLNEGSTSGQFMDATFNLFRYGLDGEVFCPVDRSFARDVFGLDRNKILFVITAERLTDERKGFKTLLESISHLGSLTEEIHFLAIGKPPEDRPTSESLISYTGTIFDERLVSIALSAADASIIPSTEDNLPNTMLESLMVGTPVIGFRIGGLAETIVDHVNGLLAKQTNSKSLAEAVVEFSGTIYEYNREDIRTNAMKRFDNHSQAMKYKRLYEATLNSQ